MISAINTALSGFNAASARLDVNARNIANASNPKSTPQQVIQSANASGGVQTSTEPLNASPTSAANGAAASFSAIDPAQQLVQAGIASYDAKANLSVIKIDQKNFQSVLNIIS